MKYSGERSYGQSSTKSQEQAKAKPTLSKRESSPLNCRIGDHVCCYNKSDQPFQGVVKWIGSSTSTRKFDCVRVGILTVSFYIKYNNGK